MSSIADSIRRSVPGTRLFRTFDVVYGGASMAGPAGRVRDVLRVPGVVAVQRDRLAHTLTTTTPHFLGADQVWPTLGGPARAGRNVVIGVLDSGIWPEHPSFRDLGLGPFPRAAGCEFGDGSDPDLGKPFTCNRKLIGAYAFTDTYMSVLQGRAGRVLRQPDRRVLGTQRRRPRDAHGIDRGRRSDDGVGLRPAPRTRERDGPGGASSPIGSASIGAATARTR